MGCLPHPAERQGTRRATDFAARLAEQPGQAGTGDQAGHARAELGPPDRADAVLGAMMQTQSSGCSYTRVEMPYDADRVSTWPRGRILV